MYLVIKELSDTAEDVIMVTQSLIKDIQSKQETVYRANAIRALCLITDVRKKEREKYTQKLTPFFFSLP
jgi:coatomer protein complex subunit gamma